MNTYKRHRSPPDIISYAVWLYFRFNLSRRDIEDLLAERASLSAEKRSGFGVSSSEPLMHVDCNGSAEAAAILSISMKSSRELMAGSIIYGEPWIRVVEWRL